MPFIRPSQYEIDGFIFPQYLSLIGEEKQWLLEKQKEDNEKGSKLLGIAQKVAKTENIRLEDALEKLGDPETNRDLLLPYLEEVKAATRSRDQFTDIVCMMLLSRIDGAQLTAAAPELKECYGLTLTEGDLKAWDELADTRIYDKVAHQIALKIVRKIPGATAYKIAQFADMESEGVATPEDLPDQPEPEVETLSPKSGASASNGQGKTSKQRKKASGVATQKSS